MTTAPPKDDRFEERLLHTILDDFDAITGDAPARRPQRSRTVVAIRRTAPALIATAAAAAVVVATVPGHAGHASPAAAKDVTTKAGSNVPRPKVHDVAYVLKHMKAATANGSYVVHEIGTAPDSQTGAIVHTQSWFANGHPTSRDETDDAAGHPISAVVSTVTKDGSFHAVAIDYRAKTWTTQTYSAPPTGGPAPLAQTPAQNADRLRAAQAAGAEELVGTAVIDGQQTIELQAGTVATGEELTWVDASTYLPVRELDTAPGQSSTGDQAIQTYDQWLPASAANLHLITAAAAIPPGFTEVG
jgi:hypothetical protein